LKSKTRAEEYAAVFFEACSEDEALSKVLYDFHFMREISSKELHDLLTMPIVPKEEKKKFIDGLKEFGFQKEIINLLKLLIDNNDEELLPQIFTEFEILFKKHENITTMDLTFAKKPSNELLELVVNGLEEKTEKFIVPKININEDIIGGIIISHQDKIIDNSIKKKFEELKKISK
jgi:F-type H+-transporting ATPase subunit delta